MRTAKWACGAGLLALALAFGCTDQAAVGRRQAAEKFNRALADLNAAIDATPDAAALKTAALQDAQMAKLLEKAKAMEDVVRSPDCTSPAQGRRVLASAYETIARRQASQAAARWATVDNQLTLALWQLSVVAAAQARADSFNLDVAPLISQLTGYRDENQSQATQLQTKINQIKDQVTALSRTRDEQQQAQATATAQRVTFEQRNGDLLGAGKYQEAAQASESSRYAGVTAAQAGRQAETATAEIDIRDAEKAILTQQANGATEGSQFLAGQITSAQTLQTKVRALRDEALGNTSSPAQASRKKALEDLDKMIAAATNDKDGAYATLVAGPLAAATERAMTAVKLLQDPAATADPDTSRAVRLDLLTAQTAAAGILAQRLVIAHAYARSLALLAQAAKASAPDRQSDLSSRADKAAAALKDLRDQTQKLLTDAQDKGSKLADGNSPEATFAQAMLASLTGTQELMAGLDK